jgi:phospholipase A1
MKCKWLYLSLFFVFACIPDMHAQIKDEFSRREESQPGFGMFRDNYFITGIPTNRKTDKYSADAKFQISIRQRVFESVSPVNASLFFTYTHKSFWDLYKKSSPMTDNNYNPGLTLTKSVIFRDKLIGMTSFSFEHESNGRDSLASRSWNYFTLSGALFYGNHLSTRARLWYGWTGSDNHDMFNFRGYGLIAIDYRSTEDRFGVSLVMNPCREALNTSLKLSLKPYKKAHHYLYLQWYQGYGENLLNYNRYTSMVRLGICIRPPGRNLY